MGKLFHILEAKQFEKSDLERIFKFADSKRLAVKKRGFLPDLEGKLMIYLFYEPSTRTRHSFEIAMKRLGGEAVGSDNAGKYSSAAKGESLEDTILTENGYSPDVIVLRHPEDGAAQRAAIVSKAPIINGGSGNREHPTQALLDVYTILKELKRVDGIKIAFVGDLLNGRTVKSLAYLLAKLFQEVEMRFVAPPELQIPEEIKNYLAEKRVVFSEHSDLREVAPEVDVIYATRIQRERLGQNIVDYKKIREKLVVDENLMEILPKKSIVMHPLPVNQEDLEIDPAIYDDPRWAGFRQSENGLYVRMALLQILINPPAEIQDQTAKLIEKQISDYKSAGYGQKCASCGKILKNKKWLKIKLPDFVVRTLPSVICPSCQPKPDK